ncbi:MAG: hypothetical protein RIC15_04420 [Vicingaceae bacterium]
MLQRISLIVLFFLLISACRKDVDSVTDDPGATLFFSELVVQFDTIFTSVGSVTRQLKVYNPSEEAVRISSIRLSGDQGAFFRMNVDGEPGNSASNILLAGKDSLYIFIDVTIDPNANNLPFLIEGQLEFVTNGNVQEVLLLAFGQNAHFILPNRFVKGLPPYRIINNGFDTTWTKDLPIVIYDFAVVDSTQRLTIEPGTQIYFHANSGLWIFRYAQLTVNGTIDEPVVFQGDRLDDYSGISGSWDRIWINDGNAPIKFDYAVIKDAFIGIQAEFNPFQGFKERNASFNQLTLNNTIIQNSKFAGLYATNFNIKGNNLLISDAGQSAFTVAGGGVYEFNNSTFANYFREDNRSAPGIFLSHLYYDFEVEKFREDSMKVDFNNCIIFGDKESEFNIEDEVDPLENINFTMRYTLVQTNIDITQEGSYQNCIFNPENTIVFANPYGADFSLAQASPAADLGKDTLLNTITVRDILENIRKTPPDMGVYEN